MSRPARTSVRAGRRRAWVGPRPGTPRAMSTTPPPDRPTEQIRPIRPEPAVVQERVVAPAADPGYVIARLEDALASLRTWLAVVALLAIVALGVAIYALTRDDDTTSGSRSGLATDERVSRVDDRVDRLSRQVQSVRASRSAGSSSGAAATSELSDRVDQLETTVKSLSNSSAPDATQAIKDLSGRIDDVAQDVEQLKQDQATTP